MLYGGIEIPGFDQLPTTGNGVFNSAPAVGVTSWY